MRGKNVIFDINTMRRDCEDYARDKGYKISTILVNNQINSSFFGNSIRNHTFDTGDTDKRYGRAKVHLYDAVCKCFELDPMKYIVANDADENPVEKTFEEPKRNDELVDILKALNENIEMIGRLCAQNHIDIMDIKECWK